MADALAARVHSEVRVDSRSGFLLVIMTTSQKNNKKKGKVASICCIFRWPPRFGLKWNFFPPLLHLFLMRVMRRRFSLLAYQTPSSASPDSKGSNFMLTPAPMSPLSSSRLPQLAANVMHCILGLPTGFAWTSCLSLRWISPNKTISCF